MKIIKLGKWIAGMMTVGLMLILLVGCGGLTPNTMSGTPPTIDNQILTVKVLGGSEVNITNGTVTKTDLSSISTEVRLYITHTDPNRDSDKMVLSGAVVGAYNVPAMFDTTETIYADDLRARLSALAVGNHTINIVVIDRKGNQSAMKSVSFTIAN